MNNYCMVFDEFSKECIFIERASFLRSELAHELGLEDAEDRLWCWSGRPIDFVTSDELARIAEENARILHDHPEWAAWCVAVADFARARREGQFFAVEEQNLSLDVARYWEVFR